MANSVTLSQQERSRYARHLSLPEVGLEGQKKLKAASILVVGTGGLGSPVLLYLAAAGIGRIGIVDFDRVEFSNLQRQIIHGTSDVGRAKVESAATAIREINPSVSVECHDQALSSANAMDIAKDYDVVIDGTDNFATRYLVNDVCVLLGKPNCYGSIFRFEGQASVFGFGDGPCYRCLYPTPPDPHLIPNCAEGGVLGVLPGLVGTIQANEAIKVVLGVGEPLVGRLLLVDALSMRFRQLTLKKDPECPVCGDSPIITEPIDYDDFCGVSKMEPQSPWDIEPSSLKNDLDAGTELLVLDVREPHEYEICNLNGKLIPLGELAGRVDELDRAQKIVVHCKLGGRSSKAVELLRQQGFEDVHNLKGGIIAWANQIDSDLETY